MVHSALKRRAFADDFKNVSHDQPSQGHDISKTASSANSSTSNITIHPPPHAAHTSRAPIPVLLEMTTPQEFATVLRARVDRLISQWPFYASQTFPHGLPSPSSSGSPQVQGGGKGIDMSTIHSFISFFYPEEHHIHHSGDISLDALFMHLSGLQTLLSFLSSKELRVIVRNRLTSCHFDRSSSVQAIVDVMRNMSAEEGDGDELELPWKRSWQKNVPASNSSNPIQTQSHVDVGIATEPYETAALLPRSSSPDGHRPLKRAKYASSYPLFQEVVDDMIMKSASIQNTTTSYHHHPDTISSSIHKMTDPILRPVSNASFKKSQVTTQVINVEDDGEADAEGDTDTDIEMDESVDERHDKHAPPNPASRLQTSFSNSLHNDQTPASIITPPSEPPSTGLTNAAIPQEPGAVIMLTRAGDISKDSSIMRMPNGSTYSVSSGSRTPPIPNRLSRVSPIPISSAMQKDLSLSRVDTPTLQVKQELLSDWEMTNISASTGDGTSHSPIEIAEQMPGVRSVAKGQKLSERRSSSFISPSGPTLQGAQKSVASCQGIGSVTKEQELTQHRYGPTLNLVFDARNKSPYDEHDLPPYDDIMTSNPTSLSSQPTSSAPDITAASASEQLRGRRGQKSPRLSKSPSRSRSRSVDGKRHRLPRKSSVKYLPQAVRVSNNASANTKQLDKRARDASSRTSSRSTSRSVPSRSRSPSRPRVPYRPRNYSYSRPPSPSSAKDRHWSPEPTRRRERGRSRSRRRRGDDASSKSKSTITRLPNVIIMDHWSPGRGRRDDDVYFESTRMDIATPMRSMGVSRTRTGRS